MASERVMARRLYLRLEHVARWYLTPVRVTQAVHSLVSDARTHPREGADARGAAVSSAEATKAQDKDSADHCGTSISDRPEGPSSEDRRALLALRRSGFFVVELVSMRYRDSRSRAARTRSSNVAKRRGPTLSAKVTES